MRCIPLPYHPHLAPPLLSATVRIGGLVGSGNRSIQLHELCGAATHTHPVAKGLCYRDTVPFCPPPLLTYKRGSVRFRILQSEHSPGLWFARILLAPPSSCSGGCCLQT